MVVRRRDGENKDSEILKAIGLRVIHRWRFKLSITLGVIPVVGWLFSFFVSEYMDGVFFSKFITVELARNIFIVYGVGLLAVLWFGPIKQERSESFVEMDLRRRQASNSAKSRFVISNDKLFAVMGGDGKVRYYPKSSSGRQGKTIEEYMASQIAEVDRLKVDVKDVEELAKVIDESAILKQKKAESSSGGGSDSESKIASDLPANEIIKETIYVSQFVVAIEDAIKKVGEPNTVG
ncbi:hypothetical protein AAHI06_07100 [Pseudomonas salmasensis]|uniref:hypothetical protein n=1 Tax=Pseudomonas salmasensis TaxID=2745514 RepID=UPI00321B8335